MLRITRLLSAGTERPRWRTPAGLLALFCTATLCASQVDLLNRQLTDLHIEESNEGTLLPGGYREITANESGLHRFYSASVDEQGQLSEYYEENDEAKPIDANVRAWLTNVAELSAIPPPPDAPAPPPAPPIAPPPPPPPPPTLAESTAFQALFKQAAADARIATLTGDAAAKPQSDRIRGHMHAPGEKALTGEAEFSFVLSGPKGRAKVEMTGERNNGVWQLTSLKVVPAS